jgi:DNA-binding response OmpR family regulator
MVNTVLVAESDEVIRGLVRAIINNAGYEALETTSGDEALRIAHLVPVHAIILDCLTPSSHGAETLKLLRADSRTAHIPVIAMCGLGQFGAELGLWAKAVVVKPFRPAQLLMKLQYVLRAQADAIPLAPQPVAQAV